MSHKRVNLISGPRNISTALMYSFGNRIDTTVVDEPMYAYYLTQTGIDHPGRQEILESLPTSIERVKDELIFQELETPVYFIKGMAHHYLDLDLEFILDLENIFLIRDPYKLILSFSKVITHPTMQDIGLQKEYDIFEFLKKNGKTPIVLDSEEVLKNPRKVLGELCERIGLPFQNSMLEWEAGSRAEDGTWAKYWYNSVHQSTGFASPNKRKGELRSDLMPLYNDAKTYYDLLLKHTIKA